MSRVVGKPLSIEEFWALPEGQGKRVVHTANALARTYKGDERLEFPDLLPGFSCMVSELFKL